MNTWLTRYGALLSGGGAEHILPVLLSGIPNNEAKADDESRKAFPDALLEYIDLPIATSFVGFDSSRDNVTKGLFYASWYAVLANVFGLSRAEVEQRDKQRERKRLATALVIAGGVIAALSVALVFALWQRSSALTAQKEAERSAAEAKQQRKLAEEQRDRASRQEQIAVAERDEAARQARIAAEQRQNAETQTGIANTARGRALARQLAAQGATYRGTKPERALLLLAEATKRTLDTTGRAIPAAEAGLREALAATGGRVVYRTERQIISMTLRADGRMLATGHEDGTVALVSLDGAGARPLVLSGLGSGQVGLVAFSPDNKWLVVRQRSPGLTLIDVANPAKRRKLSRDDWLDEASEAVFTPDSRHLITSHSDKIRIWPLDGSNQSPRELPGGGILVDLAISPSGKLLAVWGGHDAEILDLASQSTRHIQLGGELGDIFQGAWFADDETLLAASGRGLISTYKLDSGESETIQLPGFGKERGVDAIALTFDGQDPVVATASTDAQIQLWQDGSFEEKPPVLMGHEDFVHALAFSKDGQLLASAGADDCVRLWKVSQPTEEPLRFGRPSHDNDLKLSFSNSGRWLLVANQREPDFDLWALRQGKAQRRPIGLGGAHVAALSPQGNWVVAANESGAVELWNLASSAPDPVSLGTFGEPTAAGFSPDGNLMAVGFANGELRVWRPIGPRFPVEVLMHKGNVQALAFAADGNSLITSTSEGIALRSVAHLQAAPRMLEHSLPLEDLHLSRDGRWLGGQSIQTSVLWDLSERQPNPVVYSGYDSLGMVRTAVTGDDALIATIGEKMDVVVVRNLQNLGAPPVELAGNQGISAAIAASPDGQWLASAGTDKRIRLWRAHDLAAEPTVFQTASVVTALSFSPDGLWLASAGPEEPIALWSLSTERLLKLACATAGRNLSKGEWKQFLPDYPYGATCQGLVTPPDRCQRVSSDGERMPCESK